MMNTTKNILFSLLLLLTHFYSLGQFVINGSAQETSTGEYTLTKAQGNQVGTIWSEQKISLNDPFEIELELYFGTKDNGADGITFSLQPKSNTVGVSGGGLGIGGITPSLITEMDTYQNGSYGDPSFDHIALVKNTVDHRGTDNLVVPTQIVSGKNNVEDGGWYNFKAKWNPTDQVYQVFVNGIQRFSYEGDIINTVFKGQTDVFWGFTASTGGRNNDHKVRIINTTIIDLFDCTETPNDQTFCDASGPVAVNLDFSGEQVGATYEWYDAPDKTNLLSTGLTYTTPPISENTDYYVLAKFAGGTTTATFGPTPAGAVFVEETVFFDGNNRNFTVESNLIINTVDVVLPTYDGGCNASGTTLANIIDIVNSGGTTVSSTNITGICGQTTTVNLNANLTPGTYTMKLRTYQYHSFKVTGDGTEKSIPGVITLEDNTITNTWGTKNFSSVFFNWNITGGSGTSECLFAIKAEKDCPPCSIFPSLSIGSDFTYCSENDTTIKVTSSAANVLWSTSETTNEITISEGTYTVEVWDDRNCSSFENIVVNRECPSEPVILLPDTIKVCAGVLDTIFGSNIEPGSSWSGTDAFTYINDSMISINLQNDAKYSVTNYVRLNILSDNIDFEDPKITTAFKQMDASLVPGWETTASDNKVELWTSGFQGVPSYKGNQFIELNATEDAALYQDMSTSFGEVIGINLAHRGRGGVDEMQLLAGPPGGPFVPINNYVDGESWEFYTEYYTVPLGQTTTRFMFETVLCKGGPCGGSGNFLDAIEFYKVEQQADSVYVKVLQSPLLDLGNNQIVCEEDTVVLDAGNVGFNYDWNTGETTRQIEVTQSGNYSVRVYANGCEASDDVDVILEANPIVDLGNDQTVCDGVTVLLDAQNTGLDFKWSSSESTQTINPTTTDEYSVIVTNTIGCEGKDTVQVVILPLPLVNLGNDTTICEGDSIVLDAKNVGFNYIWNTSETSQIIKVKTAGQFDVVVSKAGCSAMSTVQISIQNIPIVDLGKDTLLCDGELLSLDAQNNGLSYQWSTLETTQQIQVSTSDTYNVVISDALGCVGKDTIQVVVIPMPLVDLGDDTTICEGNTITLDAKNIGFDYDWSSSQTTQNIDVSAAGKYGVDIFTPGTRCSSKDTIEIFVQKNPVINLGGDVSLCFGDTVLLDAQNIGLTYLWNTTETSQEIEVSTTGEYNVRVTDALGCVGDDVVLVTVHVLPEIILEAPTDICSLDGEAEVKISPLGGSLKGNGLNGVLFNPLSNNVVTEQLNTLVYEYTDLNNCTSIDSISIIVHLEPIIPENLLDTIICENESASYFVNVQGATAYSWFTDDQVVQGSNSQLVIDQSGIYQVEVSNQYCSSLSNQFEVEVISPQVDAYLAPEEAVFLGEPAQLIIENPNTNYEYVWSTESVVVGNGNIVEVIPSETTTYQVIATTNHCEALATVEVEVIQPIIIPSMFTPNGDGLNDYWEISGLDSDFYYELKVFNRWGSVVYKSYDYSDMWDGTRNGALTPAAVYYYVLSTEYGQIYKGSVAIMR